MEKKELFITLKIAVVKGVALSVRALGNSTGCSGPQSVSSSSPSSSKKPPCRRPDSHVSSDWVH